MKSKILGLVAVVLLTGPMVVQAQAYDYKEIEYPGTPITQIFGINNRGDAVGNGFAFPDSFPFVYAAEKGTLTDVAPIAGFSSTAILGISESGDIVGRVVSLDGEKSSGLFLSKDGTYTVFDHPDAFFFTSARAINNKGLVTGYRDTSTGEQVGFIYDSKKGTFTDFVPSLFTIAQGINARGDVVGSAEFLLADDPCHSSAGSESVRYGWLRTTDGTVTYFDVNGGRTSARGITDSGTIVGFVGDTFEAKGFVVTLDGSQCQSITVADADLMEFPGAGATIPQGITNSGVIVGQFYVDFISHGFIATPHK